MIFDQEILDQIDEEDEYQRCEPIQLGFEQELKSITVHQSDSARFEAKIRLISLSSCENLDRSLLKIEWRLNDMCIPTDHFLKYEFGSLQDENRYWLDVHHCQQYDEKVYTIVISYDRGRLHDESSAYLFVRGKYSFGICFDKLFIIFSF